MCHMGNKKNIEKTTEQNKKTRNASTPQMEKEPVVNEQDQVFPVNPQDGMFRQDSDDDFTSEHEMDQRSQKTDTEDSTKNQADYDIEEDSGSEIEETDDTSNETPKVNP